MNGAPIVLSSSGQVLDGRMRLTACLRSEATFDTLVVRGISEDAFETMDAVRKRTLADVLSIRKELHGRSLGAALRIIWIYLNGGYQAGLKAPSPMALLGMLEERPEIRDSVLPALAAMPILPHGCGIALHHLMGLADLQRASAFFELLGQPAMAGDPTPVTLVRDILGDMRGSGGARSQAYMIAVTIKAWNAFFSGGSIKQLRYSPDRESFPQIAGLKVDGRRSPGVHDLFDARPASSSRPADSLRSITARVIDMTPERADAILEQNSMNRTVTAHVIAKYARDIEAGRWLLNGQTIKISRTGKLLDGQHRLEAAKKSGKTFQTILVEGLDEDTFRSLDIGRRRGVADVLRERGETNTASLAAALRWLWMMRNDVVLAANVSPTNGELLSLLELCPAIRDSVRFAFLARDLMGSGVASALHHEFSRIDAAKAAEFFARLVDGVQLSEISPIYKLRERLMRIKTSHRVRMAEAERVAFAIKCWNAYREDRSMQLLIWRNRGVSREALPTPI